MMMILFSFHSFSVPTADKRRIKDTGKMSSGNSKSSLDEDRLRNGRLSLRFEPQLQTVSPSVEASAGIVAGPTYVFRAGLVSRI